MRHPSRWKIIAVVTAMFAGVVFAASPGLSEVQKTTTIVAELQSRELFKSIFERLAADVRTASRKAGIGYKFIKPWPNGVTGQLSEVAALDKAREIIAHIAQSGDPGFTFELTDRKLALRLPEPSAATLIDHAAEETVGVLQRRFKDLELATASVERQDGGRFLIKLPGSLDPAQASKWIGQTGRLTFQVACDAQPQNPADNPPEDCAAYAFISPPEQKIWVKTTTDAIVDGNDIIDAEMMDDSRLQQPVVNFRFNTKGAQRFAELTTANIGQPVAIILDRLVLSAPRIVEPILGGSGQISTNFTREDAANLVLVLRSGSLPAPITFISMTTEGQ
jgi:protein-export membrane protein SecD